MPGDGRGARRAGGPGPRGVPRDGHATAGHAGPGHAGPAHAGPAAPATGGPPHEPAGDPPGAPGAEEATRAVATAPAVGFFRPRADLAAGARVRAGDRIGTVDVLGVPQEVVAPVDGILGASLVEPGEPVEYGQEVVEIDLLDAPGGERGEGA
jgi:biotin carboxyl carrier protein